MRFENLNFEPMTKDDILVLTPVMKRAFDDDSRLFSNKLEGGTFCV